MNLCIEFLQSQDQQIIIRMLLMTLNNYFSWFGFQADIIDVLITWIVLDSFDKNW